MRGRIWQRISCFSLTFGLVFRALSLFSSTSLSTTSLSLSFTPPRNSLRIPGCRKHCLILFGRRSISRRIAASCCASGCHRPPATYQISAYFLITYNKTVMGVDGYKKIIRPCPILRMLLDSTPAFAECSSATMLTNRHHQDKRNKDKKQVTVSK